MADTKISALTAATTPLAGTEVLPIVQSSTTKQVSIANVTAGRSVNMAKLGLASTGTPTYEIDGSVQGADASYKLAVYGSGVAPYVRMQRARGTVASPTAIGAGGFMGNVLFDGYDGTNMVSSARIHALQAGTVSTGIVQGAIVTSTANSSGTLTEVTRADQNQDFKITTGNVIQGTAAKGFNFTANTSAAGMTSQLLNYYEEGTWTPVITALSGSYTTVDSQAGYYTKIGRLVYVNAVFRVVTKGTGTVGAKISGLPFTVATIRSTGSATNGSNVNACSLYIPTGNTYIEMYKYDGTDPIVDNYTFFLTAFYLA